MNYTKKALITIVIATTLQANTFKGEVNQYFDKSIKWAYNHPTSYKAPINTRVRQLRSIRNNFIHLHNLEINTLKSQLKDYEELQHKVKKLNRELKRANNKIKVYQQLSGGAK